MPQSGIYMIVNTITGVFYVGSAVDFKSRRSGHLYRLRHGKHHSPYLQRSYDLHGESAFVFFLIEAVPRDRNLLLARETYWVQTLQPKYNASTVSATRLGAKLTPEQVERIRQIQLDPDVRKRKSEMRLGQTLSPEIRAKISQTLTGRKVSEAVRLNLLYHSLKRTPEERRLDQLGKKRSEETRRKQSESAKKRPPQSRASIERGAAKRRGRIPSLEQRQKQSLSLKRYYQSHTISDKFRQEQSERSKAFWLNITDEKRKAMSEHASQAHMGLKRSEASRKKQSETLRAQERKHTEETRQLMSERRKEAWERKGVTDEDRKRFSAQAKSAWENKSEEEREKARQALQNNGSQSEEARKKRSESIKAWWAARKAAQQQNTEQTP